MNLALIIPCYNEEEVLEESCRILTQILTEMTLRQEISKGCIVFVDDGSKDNTWNIIQNLHESLSSDVVSLRGLKLASNVGQQNALMAGFEYTYANGFDMVITIDVDLQDDVDCIPKMVKLAEAGSEIVFGVRKSRKADSWFKRTSAQIFYSLMQNLGCKTLYNHADFRLMTHKAIGALLSYKERNLFIRGIVTNIGMTSSIVYYERKKRTAGETKYPFMKMLSFAIDGVTSFSVKPLRLITLLGALCIIIAFILICYSVYQHYRGNVEPGWTSIMTSLWFIGGSIITAIGVVGEYVGKIYKEVKHRPRYFVEETV